MVDTSACATKSVADRLQAPVFEVYSVLCRWAVLDANGAYSDAKLFICSPHSCEDVNLKKGLSQPGTVPGTSAARTFMAGNTGKQLSDRA